MVVNFGSDPRRPTGSIINGGRSRGESGRINYQPTNLPPPPTMMIGSYNYVTILHPRLRYWLISKQRKMTICLGNVSNSVPETCKYSTQNIDLKDQRKASIDFLRDRKTVPHSGPPSITDINLLLRFFNHSHKLMVLSGAGMSTESGIPDYRSPNGAYSTGFKPTTHQEFIRSSAKRRRYWARSYVGWRRFSAHQPSAAHFTLASLEKLGRIDFMVTQNVDRLHHRAGSNPLELHGNVYSVVCLDCGKSICRNSFQETIRAFNPKWASGIENLEYGRPVPDTSSGMQQRPDGDIEINEKYLGKDFTVPDCDECGGLLKPDVVFFSDNVPRDRADRAMEAARSCDALLVLGSSLMTLSAFRLVRAAFEANAAIALVNIGETRADDFVPLKINARCGEILPRLLDTGCITIPSFK